MNRSRPRTSDLRSLIWRWAMAVLLGSGWAQIVRVSLR